MKKVVANLLVLILIVTGVTALAISDNDVSKSMLNILIGSLSESEDANMLFDLDTSRAYIDSDGDMMVRFMSNFSYSLLKLSEEETLEFVSIMWTTFHDIHSGFSSSDIYFCIAYEEDIIYFTGGDFILDAEYNSHPFLNSL